MAERRDENVYREQSRLMDVNTATYGELAQLPGIDKKHARDIVRLRESLGGFDDLEQLRAIPGFSAEAVDRLRQHLAVKRRLR